jgi:RNA polymerase sigma-70 factor (ECF subfamily)
MKSPPEPSPRIQHERDLELVRRARAGDPRAANRLVERLVRVARLVPARLGGLRDARYELDELVQDTLMALWAKLHLFDGSSSLEAWAYGFVAVQHRKAAERARTRAAGRPPLESELAREQEPAAQREEYSRIHECISALKRTQAIIVRSIHFEDQSFSEIASRLALPRGTVKTKYYRGSAHLRRSLHGYWARRAR